MSQHQAAKSWLDKKLNAPAPVGIPWPSVLAFMRLVTNPRIFENPESMNDAWKQVESWLHNPVVWIPAPSDRHFEILSTLIATGVDHSNLIPDAHLAALAIEHGLIVCSSDGDFARFKDVRWENPI
jgi:toxin-antitoxin system PIN domain toxin